MKKMEQKVPKKVDNFWNKKFHFIQIGTKSSRKFWNKKFQIAYIFGTKSSY